MIDHRAFQFFLLTFSFLRGYGFGYTICGNNIEKFETKQGKNCNIYRVGLTYTLRVHIDTNKLSFFLIQI